MPIDEFQQDVIERLTRIETRHDERSQAIVDRLDKQNGRIDKHDTVLAVHASRLDRASGIAATVGGIAATLAAGIIEGAIYLFKRGGK